MNNNIACRIFKEQMKLINQLPENERAAVLYLAVNNSFNQIENQNDNQIENQNENAYVSVSDSVSESLSEISKCVLELLKKNIVCKNFSNNYGGRRDGSGRPPKNDDETDPFVIVDVDSGKLDISEEATNCLSNMPDGQYVKAISWIRDNLNGRKMRKSSLSKAVLSFTKEVSNG